MSLVLPRGWLILFYTKFHNFYQIGNRRELPYRLFITEQGIPYTGLTGETFTSFVPAVYIGEYVACQLASNQVRDKKGI